ncbi:hypothetical protein ACQXZL_03835 [Corynebacterium diphtheriae]|uniref:Uncharacterized protein n=1 Tax=Corynebacterium diphtheriae TaxID=1717 RepID=A0A811G4N5_CORDP|nr:hypothetical protein [Corynebacterium diphtheriae]AEX70294.1 putative membrane protein [Corynebacterium diphtheriae PW8]OFI59123.1 hypothetical protein BKD85_02600 [Corynebacterium diphtheriae]OFI65583.1 hypothetical protein BKD81_02595 [Corynebacterium diphtheriae]OJH97388.1 hypothetical protein BJU21_11240 [Corynebacterium diphtheriae]OOG35229.1 hypothetical protein BKD86_0202365 [Corynebacterium diphtheriae]
MKKSSLKGIVLDHFGTLIDNKDKSRRLEDWLTQVGLPIVIGVVCFCRGVKLGEVGTAVSGVSIVSALLCAMAVFLFQLRVDLSKSNKILQRDYDLVDQCMFNTLWAIVWGMGLSVFLIVCEAGGWLDSAKSGPVVTGIAVAASVHFVLVIAMCLKRLREAYRRIGMKDL